MRIIGIILLSFFMFIGNVFAMDMSLQQKKMCENIIKTMNETPNNWIFKSYELIYATNPDTVEELREMSYPESDSASELVIKYNLYKHCPYVYISKPFEMHFKGKTEKKLILAVKKLMYKQLRDEVGSIVSKEEKKKKKEKPAVEPKPLPVKTITENGFNKL